MKALVMILTATILTAWPSEVFAQNGLEILWQTNTPLTPVLSVAISRDSSSVAATADNPGPNVRTWSTATGELLRTVTYSGGIPFCVALSSDGSYVSAGAGGGRTRTWRVSDGIRVWIGGPDGGETVHSLSLSPNDAYLGIGRSDGINVVNAPFGGGIPFGEPPGEVFGVCFSPDGNALASANDTYTASLWNMPGGELVREFIGHSNAVSSVDFSPDASLLATASWDGTVRIWNVTNGVCLRVMEGGSGVAKFSADGKLLYTLSDYTFKIWRVASGACVKVIEDGSALTFDLAKNGKYFAYGTIQGSVIVARMPLVIDDFSRTGNESVLSWQGGSGLYQLQSSTNLATNVWQNVGSPTTNTLATNVSSSTLFFRVQSLPNP